MWSRNWYSQRAMVASVLCVRRRVSRLAAFLGSRAASEIASVRSPQPRDIALKGAGSTHAQTSTSCAFVNHSDVYEFSLHAAPGPCAEVRSFAGLCRRSVRLRSNARERFTGIVLSLPCQQVGVLSAT